MPQLLLWELMAGQRLQDLEEPPVYQSVVAMPQLLVWELMAGQRLQDLEEPPVYQPPPMHQAASLRT